MVKDRISMGSSSHSGTALVHCMHHIPKRGSRFEWTCKMNGIGDADGIFAHHTHQKKEPKEEDLPPPKPEEEAPPLKVRRRKDTKGPTKTRGRSAAFEGQKKKRYQR
eukprot:344122_1